MPYTKSYEEFHVSHLPDQLKKLWGYNGNNSFEKERYILVFRGHQKWPRHLLKGPLGESRPPFGDRFIIANSKKFGLYNICDKKGHGLEINGEWDFTEQEIVKWCRARKFSVITL